MKISLKIRFKCVVGVLSFEREKKKKRVVKKQKVSEEHLTTANSQNARKIV